MLKIQTARAKIKLSGGEIFVDSTSTLFRRKKDGHLFFDFRRRFYSFKPRGFPGLFLFSAKTIPPNCPACRGSWAA